MQLISYSLPVEIKISRSRFHLPQTHEIAFVVTILTRKEIYLEKGVAWASIPLSMIVPIRNSASIQATRTCKLWSCTIRVRLGAGEKEAEQRWLRRGEKRGGKKIKIKIACVRDCSPRLRHVHDEAIESDEAWRETFAGFGFYGIWSRILWMWCICYMKK